MLADPRPATHRDLDAVLALVRAAYAVHVPRIGREPAPMGADYQALIARGLVHVAPRDGEIRGLLVLVPGPDALLVENVAVAPSAQGAGLGRALMAFAERAAREAGFRAVRLYTHVAMAENIAFYGRLGYAETGRTSEDGFRRVHMLKRIG